MSVNALFTSKDVSEAAAFAANEATFAKIARETEGIATARTIAGPTSMENATPLWTPSPGEQTAAAPHAAVLREMGLRVARFDDVPRVAHVYETNDAGSIEAYWSLRDSSEAESEALALAIREARRAVDAFGRPLGLHVVAVRRVEPKRPTRPYYAESYPTRFPERPPYVNIERGVTVTYVLSR